ncbi:uncharacterized protein LOC115212192 [Octopus sinensis]|uniref:Uncharacterized protein LOC115212192 n=1 Tax=Octopus sinensis TaxID=2607531 RepID=A0A6P7SEW4_9MOLL|nr:uncharacterized protein LOC115212192 [Octopus sinensis]
MDRNWHRHVIKYLSEKGSAPNDIYTDKVVTLRDDTPGLPTVQKEALEFKRKWESLGRSATVTTEENIDCVHPMVINERQLTIDKISNAVSISYERVENILLNELDMTKVYLSGCLLCDAPDDEVG